MNDKLNKGDLIVWQRAVYINPEGAAAQGGEELVVGQIGAERPAGHHVTQQYLDNTQSIHPKNHVIFTSRIHTDHSLTNVSTLLTDLFEGFWVSKDRSQSSHGHLGLLGSGNPWIFPEPALTSPMASLVGANTVNSPPARVSTSPASSRSSTSLVAPARATPQVHRFLLRSCRRKV